MAFLISFIQYAIKFVIMVAVAGCGIFIGKKMRDRKNA
ncbi:MAG: vanadium nitrogenase [Lachnospiraceae bacterium]